jgi:CheY-like chemotaxis protein
MKREILIADDDIITQNMVKTTLSSAGYAVLVASTGQEAVKLAKEKLPALIILDINMPEMDGGEAAEVIRNDPKIGKIPIIFLSALVTEKEEKISGRKNLMSFMSKPYNREKLLNEVRKRILESESA